MHVDCSVVFPPGCCRQGRASGYKVKRIVESISCKRKAPYENKVVVRGAENNNRLEYANPISEAIDGSPIR